MAKILAKAQQDICKQFYASGRNVPMYVAEEDIIYCFAILRDSNDNTLYSNLTWRFLVDTYDGENYIFIAYVYK